ncbi:MAG: ATP F0F1 synthase subunit I [Porticoccaceae bacterium]|nr:MAG: ATP F0F1 synthase subunit I [Porticoccaceae bacterium]
MKATIEAPPVGRIAITQFAILLVAAIALVPIDATIAYSILIGGTIQIVPQAYFTRLAFRYMGARQAPEMLRAIQKGETGKLLLTGLFFALTFIFVKPINVTGLFLSYSAMIIVQWFCAARALNHRKI